MSMPGMSELLVILAIIVLLFGAKKIPDLAKGIGKGIKDFKKAVKEDDDEISEAKPLDNSSEKKVVESHTTEKKSENA